jgi:uncharacterized protein YbaP (TraB family)
MMYERTGETRRSRYFAVILFLANAYLIGFAVDGGTSVLDDFVGTLTGSRVAPLGALRELIANLVVVSSFVMLLVLVAAPRLPKLLFLPLIAFAIWCGLDAPPLLWPGRNAHPIAVVLAIAQAAIACAAFLLLKARTGNWLLTRESLPSPRQRVLKIAVSAIATAVVVPALIGSLLAMDIAALIQSQTDSYIQFTASGIDLQETVLRKGDKTVRLIGMLHVGEPRFYQSLYASFPKGSLILEEGVSDREKRLAGNFSYQKFARVLGLEQQPHVEASLPAAQEVNAPGKAKPPSAPAAAAPTTGADNIMHPDVDVSDFSDSTIRFLVAVGKVYQGGSPAQIVSRIVAVMNDFSQADIEKFYDDVIHNRNKHVLAAFDSEIAHYDSVVIPWGAMHMPDLEKQLKARGFAVESRQRLPLLRYGTILKRLGTASHA